MKKLLVVLIASVLATGCANTSMVGAWTNPSYASKPITENQRVWVMFVHKEERIRRVAEDEIVRLLKQKGVDAVQSYLTLNYADNRDAAKVDAAIAKAGATRTLISDVLRTEKKFGEAYAVQNRVDLWDGPFFNPTIIVDGQVRRRYNTFGGFFSDFWGVSAGYQIKQNEYQNVFIESKLFNPANNELMWAGESKIFAAEGSNYELRSLAGDIVKALSKQQLIGK